MSDDFSSFPEPKPTDPALVGGGETSPSTRADPFHAVTDPRSFVEAYLDVQKIRVTADSNLARHQDENTDLLSKLRLKPIDDKVLLDEIVEFCAQVGFAFAKSDIARGIRLAISDRSADRRARILEPLLQAELSPADGARAEEHFEHFAKLFEAPEAVVIGGLKQFMFTTKRKQILERVGYPLMPIVMNKVQGSGKSELVLRILNPLGELASDPVPFSEVADPRSSTLFTYAVVNIDDAGRMPRGKVAELKAAITTMNKQNRVLGSSKQRRIVNRASFIATTNENILSLVPDETGHRRFLFLLLKNGAVEKGGSSEIWQIMDDLDFDLMWRSVPVTGEEPIKAVLDQLHAYQAGYVPPDPILTWLKAFDPASEAARNITAPHKEGGRKIYGSKLFKLYCDETDAQITVTAFGSAVKDYIAIGTGGVPFVEKGHDIGGNFFLLKASSANAKPGS